MRTFTQEGEARTGGQQQQPNRGSGTAMLAQNHQDPDIEEFDTSNMTPYERYASIQLQRNNELMQTLTENMYQRPGGGDALGKELKWWETELDIETIPGQTYCYGLIARELNAEN